MLDEQQQAAVTGRPESKQALISGTPPAPSILRYSVAKQKVSSISIKIFVQSLLFIYSLHVVT